MTRTDWKLKLAAWLHDPAEKGLILMRTSEGHEFGTAKRLREHLDIDYGAFDKRADWLAAAADRPQWPRQEAERYPTWANVSFVGRPVLIHPLSGQEIALDPLAADVGAAQIKAVSVDHFKRLIVDDDPRLTFLGFWRFGPEAGRWAPELGSLWQMLPADTRTPDHSIWAHLDTVSALHTALADGDRPALLAMSFGPVQGFIAQARATSDLWAGSHLLSSILWEGIKTIVSDLGPDAVLFPALRGVPAVDAWLLEQGDAFRSLFEEVGAEFLQRGDDTNPLFAAALPNKLVCVVPSGRAREFAEAAIAAARQRALEIAGDAACKVFDEVQIDLTETTRAQIEAQVAEFPEAFWAASVWPIGSNVRDLDAAAERLQAALTAIHPDLGRQGVFHRDTWPILTRELDLDGWQFWKPNAGILYPAVYELAERSLAAVKSARPFAALDQVGYRCTQCGEREWLTDHKGKLSVPPGKRKPKGKAHDEGAVETVWAELAVNPRRRAWAKAGEHLCALCTAKRLWPTLFAEEVGRVVGRGPGEKVDRFVISTHALALATSLDRLLAGWTIETGSRLAELSRKHGIDSDDPVALPKALHSRMRRTVDANSAFVIKRLPSAIERLGDAESQGLLDRDLIGILGRNGKPETYYALIQMDGDRMGAWLAGNEDEYKLRYRETWHPQVRAEAKKAALDNEALGAYLDALRPPSPARHASISRALNDFSIHLARHVVEDCVKGKLLYAGGDDVLALVAVDDLFDAMQLLRLAYSGLAPHENMKLGEHVGQLSPGGSRTQQGLLLNDGFGLLRGRLMTLMGHKATASIGAVVAHHQAPLAMVLRRLREAENRAKNHRRKNTLGRDSDRDAFCVRVLKRGGGEVGVTSPWWPVGDDCRPHVGTSALRLMKDLRDELAQTSFSRGAVYRAELWFEGLTDEPGDIDDDRWRAQMAGSLAYQFDRQNKDAAGKKRVARLARDVVDFVCEVMRPAQPRTALDNLLVTAEFFARESRVKDRSPGSGDEGKPDARGAGHD